MSVVVMSAPLAGRTDAEMGLRRLAIQIAAQLPETEADALAVLAHAKTLVQSFVGDLDPV